MAEGLKWKPCGNALAVAFKGFLSHNSGYICKTVKNLFLEI